jgi:ribosome biogenesis GTPase / thiamine phosphate phosphatase
VRRRTRLGWNDFFQEQIASDAPPPQVARIVEEQRGAYRVAGDFDGWAEVSGKFRHDAQATADFPAVGDWVCVTPPAGLPRQSDERSGAKAGSEDLSTEARSAKVERGVITRRLERRSTISRKAAGRVVQEQVLAANVDTIFLVTALAEDLNPRRLERYLTVVRDAGAVPVVVLNKTDLITDPETQATDVRARLPFVDVLAISAKRGEGLSALDAYLSRAQTVALIGSSGVGKSTLVNRLLGHERLKTAEISDVDGKGRHTTTARHLVELPGGALLIDTPGMRELQPWVDESAVTETFEDIAELARGCRFADCAHDTEPGCAVLAAVERGELGVERLDHFRHLGREIAFEERKRDKSAAAAEKRRWRKIHQANKVMYRDRDRDRG